MKKLLPAFLLLLMATAAQAQVTTDSLAKDVEVVKKDVAALAWLKKFRLSAYLQMQYQHVDTAGAKSFEGGDFAAASDNRFRIRRGRLKLEFSNENKKGMVNYYAMMQINMTESGVNLMDFYGRVLDPFVNWVSISGGLMNRPFGHAVSYSSRVRETPERGRMSQILFPQERDLGFMLTVEPSKKNSALRFFRINAGLYNGTGLGFSEIDRKKDFIGQVILYKDLAKGHLKLSGGASYYNGAVLQSTPVYYRPVKSNGYHYEKVIDSAGVGKNYFKREYLGFDAQVSGEYKWGRTAVRGEYIFGKQPGTANSDGTPTATGSDIWNRNFSGAYFYFIQGFHDNKHNMWHELVFKYDYFDPNVKTGAKNISSANDAYITGSDVKYQSFGVGYNFRPSDWFKLMVYYAIVKNEATALPGFTRDLKDNVFTVRTQFSFDSDWFKKK